MNTTKSIKKNKNADISKVLADYSKKINKIKREFLSLQILNRKNIDERKINDIRKTIWTKTQK